LLFIAIHVSRFCCSHSGRFPRFLSVTPLRSATWEFFSTCLCVLINSQFPRRSECTRPHILARRRQANMRVSHLSPAARNRQENLRCLFHKRCLLLQRSHQIYVALCLRRERSKFLASCTKSRQSRVRVLFHALQAQGHPAKTCCGHVAIPIRQREYRISPLADGICLPLGEGSRATWKAASGLTSQEFAKWRGRSRLHGVGFWCTDLNRHAKLRLFAVSSASTRLPTEVRIEGKQNRAPTF